MVDTADKDSHNRCRGIGSDTSIGLDPEQPLGLPAADASVEDDGVEPVPKRLRRGRAAKGWSGEIDHTYTREDIMKVRDEEAKRLRAKWAKEKADGK